MSQRRIVVVQAEQAPDQPLPWIPVGVHAVRGQPERLALVAKTTFDWPPAPSAGGAWVARLAAEQLPLVQGQPSTLAGASEGELEYPSDFVFPKEPSEVAADGVVDLVGLWGNGEPARLRLPGLEPVVTVDTGPWKGLPVPMRCDTFWLDVDRQKAVLVWRGIVEQRATKLRRIALALEPMGQAREGESRLGAMQRGRLGFAVRTQDPTGHFDALDPREQRMLKMARRSLLGSGLGEPGLPLGEYAAVAAELAQRADARSVILLRQGLDEHRWLVEERAWLERAGRAALDGNGEPARELGQALTHAHEALPRHDDLCGSLADYAAVRRQVHGSMDPAVILRSRGIPCAEWARIEKIWAVRLSEDLTLRDELAELTAVPGGSGS